MKINFAVIIEFFNDKNIIYQSDIDPDSIFEGISSVDNSKKNFITFFSNQKYSNSLKNTLASACIINNEFMHLLPKDCSAITVKDPYKAFANLTHLFASKNDITRNISINSIIDEQSKIGKNVKIGNFVVIKENTIIEDNCIIEDHCVIGPNTNIGCDSTINPSCVISNTLIGNQCVLQSGCIIGEKGFGFLTNEKTEIVHVGNVSIGNNTEIGSNTTIDRATIDSTVVGNNVRIDNLVHIAHNVKVGDNTIIAGQTGIAGGVVIGSHCMIGGQVGIAGHITIGDKVMIAAKSGVTKNIINNSTVAGFPAIDIKKWRKIIVKQYKK